MQLPFVKLHGLGNDFVVVDNMDSSISLTPEQVVHICDRHFGVGADGVILVQPSPHDNCIAYMHYINSDGTLAEMCGNGIRCFAKFLCDNNYVNNDQTSFFADTKRGPLQLQIHRDEKGDFESATVDMDEPILDAEQIPTLLASDFCKQVNECAVLEQTIQSPWGEFAFTCISMGNPHAICFLDAIETLPDEWFSSNEKSLETFKLNEIGSYFESHEVFPAKSNIEFIVPENDGLHMRVYERGCGETLACGTGACATLVASVLTNRSKRQNNVILRGGILHITWDKDTNHVFMTGPAEQSFTGVIQL